ncbi:MAG: sigma-70 family RNA polymerase sigma factor [Opitutaceae bacterium]|nr:sigma-70 family RNA polymerase sigma factor [Opitutaceae bacterium]
MSAPSPHAHPSEPDDAALMHRIQISDESAFAQLMQRWERPVKAVIARIVLNTSEAEDLAQETFVRLWQHRDRFDPSKSVKPWILGIAVNLARNRLRWWRRRPSIALDDWTETPEAGSAPATHGSQQLEHAEQTRAVRDALAALPPHFREVLVLFEFEGLSYADIALALGTTPKTVENRLTRGREKLRLQLRRWW